METQRRCKKWYQTADRKHQSQLFRGAEQEKAVRFDVKSREAALFNAVKGSIEFAVRMLLQHLVTFRIPCFPLKVLCA